MTSRLLVLVAMMTAMTAWVVWWPTRWMVTLRPTRRAV